MVKTKAELRRVIRQRLRAAGFQGRKALTVPEGKDSYRRVHRMARRHEIDKRRDRIRALWKVYKDRFANGAEVRPEEIVPRLEPIAIGDDEKNELFWLARMYWSLPYSQGYGRRMRFFLWDDSTGCLIGLLGLQSPPLDFAIRDVRFAYPKNEKTRIVNQMMDAYTVGALPPYNQLLGGKLAAYALAAKEVREAYRRRYAGMVTRLEERTIPPRLIAITTTSAFGKSSVYDRVKDANGNLILESLGVIEQTHGTYHLNGVYPLVKDFLKRYHALETSHGYGVGPRVRWQVLRKGLRKLGLPETLIQHRVPREVFLVSHLKNLGDYASGGAGRPLWHHRKFDDLAGFWRNRWLLPRWQRIKADPVRAALLESWNKRRLIGSILNA